MSKPQDNSSLEVKPCKKLTAVPITRDMQFYRGADGGLYIRVPPSKQN